MRQTIRAAQMVRPHVAEILGWHLYQRQRMTPSVRLDLER